MKSEDAQIAESHPNQELDEPSMLDSLTVLARHWRGLFATAISTGVLALGATYVMAPTYTASTVFLPPQQSQNGLAASALAALGPLAGLAAGSAIRSPGEQFVALMQSRNVSDRLIDSFKLQEVYDKELLSETRIALGEHVSIGLGKKDGLITVIVEDEEAQRAADMANAYVAELRRVTSELALTEAQQRRAFFDKQLQQTRERLAAAQTDLQASGVTMANINAEPKAAVESYARLKAEHTAATVRLQGMRAYLSDQSIEVKQALSAIATLQAKLKELEGQGTEARGADSAYLNKYREFKYQEALFETFSRQFELARLDEAREGGLIQVVDVAQVPDRRSRPKRLRTAALFTLLGLIFGSGGLLYRDHWRRQQRDPAQAKRWNALRQALRG